MTQRSRVADGVADDNDGAFRGNNVIKFLPAKSVAKFNIGDRIKLTAAQFERLATAFLAEIESKFLSWL